MRFDKSSVLFAVKTNRRKFFKNLMTGVDDAGFFIANSQIACPHYIFARCSQKHMRIFPFFQTDRLFFNVIFIKIILFGQN